MTDERPEGAATGADDTPPIDTPEEAHGAPEPIADSLSTPPDGDGEADEAGEAGERGGRPPLAVILVSVLILAAIGAGLAFLLPSGPLRAVDQGFPATPSQASLPSSVPTALPLPEATGEYSSTEVIVEVGDGAIIRGDFVRQYQPGLDPAELLNQLIQVELVLQAAASEGVTPDAELIESQVAQIKAFQAGGDDALFASFLDQAMIGSEENLRRLLERDSVLEQMILLHTPVEQVRARHILLATDETTDTAQLEALQGEAQALLEEIEAGADFAALAAEHSDDTGSAQNGGDLGWAPRGLFVAPFDEAVFSMAVGELRLVQTQFGWHIIEVIEAPQMRPLDSVDMLQTPAGQQAFAETFLPWVESLQQQAEAAGSIRIVVPAEQLVTQSAGS